MSKYFSLMVAGSLIALSAPASAMMNDDDKKDPILKAVLEASQEGKAFIFEVNEEVDPYLQQALQLSEDAEFAKKLGAEQNKAENDELIANAFAIRGAAIQDELEGELEEELLMNKKKNHPAISEDRKAADELGLSLEEYLTFKSVQMAEDIQLEEDGDAVNAIFAAKNQVREFRKDEKYKKDNDLAAQMHMAENGLQSPYPKDQKFAFEEEDQALTPLVQEVLADMGATSLNDLSDEDYSMVQSMFGLPPRG